MMRRGRLVGGVVVMVWLAGGVDVMANTHAPAFQLPSIFSDGMVLQQGARLPIWGWAAPGERIRIVFAGQTVEGTADEHGRWRVALEPLEATFTAQVLQIKHGPEEERVVFEIHDVVVGEVWVAGGQSNMWWKLARCKNGAAEIEAADYPWIRLWDANTHPRQEGWAADTPRRDVSARWQSTHPERAGDFPGTPYFFARHLFQHLNVPVGIVHLAVPGVPIEPFLSEEAIVARCPHVQERWLRDVNAYPRLLAAHEAETSEWREAHAAAEAAGARLPPRPRPPRDPETRRPGPFLNGMVMPVASYAAHGVLWWQGESNTRRAEDYACLLSALMQEWRSRWEQPDLPFLVVELQNAGPRQTRPVEDAPWPALREAQAQATRSQSRAWLVSIIDIKEDTEAEWEIHPHHKQLAGYRLYRAALQHVYQAPRKAGTSPQMKAWESDGDHIILHMSEAIQRNEDPLRGFAVAGSDRRFHWAEAKWLGPSRIQVSSAAVPLPVAARYAWANNPVGNAVGESGLPVHPFRTDDWPLSLEE